MSCVYEEIGRRVLNARLRAGLTQQETAAAVGLTRCSIANLEAGRQRIPLHVLMDLAAACGVPFPDLLPADLYAAPARRVHV